MINERNVSLLALVTVAKRFVAVNGFACPGHFSENSLNTDTRIIRALRHVPLVSLSTGFQCTSINGTLEFSLRM